MSTDPRPRPKYGEYATPQQQAEIVAKSMPPVSPLLVPHGESVPAPSGLSEPEKTADKPAEKMAQKSADAPDTAVAPKPARRRWDLILSVGLLAYGLVTVLAGFAQYSDIPALMNQVYETQSIGTFTPSELSANTGTVIVVTTVLLYAATAWLTVRRLMAGRIAFWIPLVGGVIAAIVTMIAIGAVIVNDPAFQDYLSGVGIGA